MTGTIASAVSIFDGTEILPGLQEVIENYKPIGRGGREGGQRGGRDREKISGKRTSRNESERAI